MAKRKKGKHHKQRPVGVWGIHRCAHGKAYRKNGTYVYLLTTRSGRNSQKLTHRNTPHTYIGCTNDPMRRLKQHNGKLEGGSKYTKRVGRKGTWAIRALVSGFCCRRMALMFERKWKDVNMARYARKGKRGDADRVMGKLKTAGELASKPGVKCKCPRLTVKRMSDKFDLAAGMNAVVQLYPAAARTRTRM